MDSIMIKNSLIYIVKKLRLDALVILSLMGQDFLPKTVSVCTLSTHVGSLFTYR